MTTRPSAIVFIDSSNFYHSLKEAYDLALNVEGFMQLFAAQAENTIRDPK